MKSQIFSLSFLLLCACQTVLPATDIPLSASDSLKPPTEESAKPVKQEPVTQPEVQEPGTSDQKSENTSFQFRLQEDFTQENGLQPLKQIEIVLLDGEAKELEHFAPSSEELKRGFIFGSEGLHSGQEYALEVVLTREDKGCLLTEIYPIEQQKIPEANALPVRVQLPSKPRVAEPDCAAQKPETDEMGLSSEDRTAMYYIVRANTTAINYKKQYNFIKTYHPEAEISEQLQDIYWFLVYAGVEVEILSNKIISFDAATGSAEIEAERKMSIAYTGEEYLQQTLYKLRLDGKFWKILEIVDLTPAENYVSSEDPGSEAE